MRYWVTLVVVFALTTGAGLVAFGSSEDPVAEEIRRLLSGPSGEVVRVRGEPLGSSELVRGFYQQRGFAAAWTAASARTALVDSMLAAVRLAEDDGLRAEDYHAAALTLLAGRFATAPMGIRVSHRAELEVLLTDAFLTFAHHRLHGRVDPRLLHEDWLLPARTADLPEALQTAMVRGAPGAVLRTLDPPGAEYDSLRGALRRYREFTRMSWPLVPPGAALRPGEVNPAVRVLRVRLAVESGSQLRDTSSVFDEDLEAAVRLFQRTRGLIVDGVVGPETRAALAVTPSQRTRQIVSSMERLRWQGSRPRVSIEVTIPAFELRLFEHDRVVMVRRIIGGRADWPTPIFGSRVDAVTFSPYWNVPPRIAALEVLPKVRRDPGWLAREHMRVLSGWGADARVIDASRVDWSRMTAANFPYRFRQDAGPGNPLGGVKFSIPSRWDVYLHDTSEPRLFERPLRSFSHGCMRLEQPLDVAEYLLRDDTAWSRVAIEAAARAAVERTIRLRTAVPFHVIYRTVWTDDAGLLHFGPDVYGHDARLEQLLAAGTSSRWADGL